MSQSNFISVMSELKKKVPEAQVAVGGGSESIHDVPGSSKLRKAWNDTSESSLDYTDDSSCSTIVTKSIRNAQTSLKTDTFPRTKEVFMSSEEKLNVLSNASTNHGLVPPPVPPRPRALSINGPVVKKALNNVSRQKKFITSKASPPVQMKSNPVWNGGSRKTKKYMDLIMEEVEQARIREQEWKAERGLPIEELEDCPDEEQGIDDDNDDDEYIYSKDSPALYKGPFKGNHKEPYIMSTEEKIKYEIEQTKAREKELRQLGLLKGRRDSNGSLENNARVQQYWQATNDGSNIKKEDSGLYERKPSIDEEKREAIKREEDLRMLRGIQRYDGSDIESSIESTSQHIAYFNKLSGFENGQKKSRGEKTEKIKKLTKMFEQLSTGKS
ncbi:hypothetical protein ACOME3_005738 [Neoechinorhynchus agilis]